MSEIGSIMIGFFSICFAFCAFAQFIDWCCYKKSDFWEKQIKKWKERSNRSHEAEKEEKDFTDIRLGPLKSDISIQD